MAFGDLSSNQMVSYAEASTSNFTLVPGESHFTTLPAANQCMTKSNALAKYVLNAANMAGYSDNQIVPKSAWTPGASYGYTFYTQDSFSATGSCMVSGSTFTLYSGDTSLAVNSRLYQDINLTDTFYAGEIQGDWYHGTDNKAYRIQNYWDPNSTYDPKIAEIVNCLTAFSPGFNNSVLTVEYQSDGKILVGGSFTAYKGVTVNRLARLFPDGTLDTDFTFGTGFNNTVYCTKVLSDGRIAVGGAFTQCNGVTVNRIVILNPEGTIHTTMTGANGSIISIASNGDYLIAGGAFSTFNGASSNRIVSFHNTTGVINPYFTVGNGFSLWAFGYEQAIIHSVYMSTDGWLYVGGYFDTYRDTSANKFVKLSTLGSLMRDYDIEGESTSNGVHSIVSIANDAIVCAGTLPDGNIRAFTSAGAPYEVFGTGFNSRINKVSVVEGGRLLVSGEFGTYKGQNTGPSIKLFFGLQTYNKELDYNPDFSNPVYTHAVDSNNNVIYGGAFTVVADSSTSRTSNRIAQFSSTGVLISN